MKWKLLSALLGVSLAQVALATIPLYQNLDVVSYDVFFDQVSPNPPPTIDAKAFDNENVFSVSYQNYTPSPVLYQTWNTLNYTNLGTLIANSPAVTNGAYIFLGIGSFGSGYQVDLHTTNQISHAMAGSFYNSGAIRCDSIQDGNNLFSLGGGFYMYMVTSLGQFKASATNIICPGSIDVGTGGLIQMTGRNVDLTGGMLSVESLLNALGNPFNIGTFGTINFNSTGAVGVDTNGDWNPFLYLRANSALSSFVPISPFYVQLTNSQCYLDQKFPSPTYTINRYVFVQNASRPNVTYNVYIDPPNTFSLGFEPGAAHVEWVGTYTDPASGNPITDYLYLTDNYLFGASTNVAVINGVPDNFTFITSPTQLLFGPTPIGVPVFPDAFMSNNYAVMFGTLTASTVSTNASLVNPSGNVTNLPGAIKISANNTLNLAYSTISGLNYLSLNCTNQFQGSPGAAIAAPYSDIYLGVTNGFMTMSNVLMANIPNWSGTIDAWSTAWVTVDALGNTNDYRVMLVFSDLQPTASPWIQNLYLHGTNTLVVSDPLNVFGSFYSDARILTLNTNQLGVGASSLDGELTWVNPLPFNANSGSGVQQMPNLLWVTNNGAIRILHNATFGNAATPQFVVTPAVPVIRATGTLSETGANAVKNDKVIIGTNEYMFVTVLTNTAANKVKIAATFDGSMNNLIAAINHGAGSGTSYSTNTKANPKVTAGALAGGAFTVTAITTNAAAGNAIPTLFTPATAAVNLTWSGHATLYNGVDTITNYTSFNNHSLIADQGTAIWTTYFENGGVITNGSGSFTLHSGMAMLTNGSILAGGDVLLVATNTPGMGVNALIISNHMIQAGHKLTLWSTNITDGVPPGGLVVTNGNFWSVGATSGGGSVDSGFNIPVMPLVGAGDLLGTTVTNIAPASKTVYNVWAGHDYGRSTRGYSNNLALGRLVLDTFGPDNKVAQIFTGAGVSNALYVDCLILEDSATHGNATNSYNFPWLKINTNMMIYYAQALEGGDSVAEALDNTNFNGGRLRWIYSYAGYFSSTNLVFTNLDGTTYTNPVNAALAQSRDIDSDSDGIPNNVDPTPFLMPSEAGFTVTLTNLPPLSAKVQWSTIPNATNFIYYTTNLFATNWLAFTNFKNWYYGNNVAVTNAAHGNSFHSPQVYVNNASLPDNSQRTNVWVFDTITNMPHYYRVVIWPWLNFPE